MCGRRAAALPQTRQTRCWPSSERTTHPSPPRKREGSSTLSLVLFPPNPLSLGFGGSPALRWCLLALAVKTAHSGSCGLERRSFALTQVSVSQACFQMQKAEKQLLQGFPHLSFRYRADANQMQSRGRNAGVFNLPQLRVIQCFQ